MTGNPVHEPIVPEPGSFDTRAMARGEPGVPRRFRWRDANYEVAEVEKTWRELNPPAAAAGDQYVRRHGYVVRTTSGERLRLVAERGLRGRGPRWWLREVLGD